MSFWKRKRQSSEQSSSADDTGQVQKARKGVKRSPPLAMEVKILALEALESGLSAIEVGESEPTLDRLRQSLGLALRQRGDVA